MKKRIYYLAMTFLVLIASCSKDVEQGGQKPPKHEFGAVVFSAKMDMSVTEVTRSGVTELPSVVIPNSSNLFSLDILGTYVNAETGVTEKYEKSYATLAEYDLVTVPAGEYAASLALGKEEEEGINLAAFAGNINYNIIAGKTIKVSVPVKLVNSAVDVVFTDYFNNYFTDATFTIRTTSNKEYNYTKKRSNDWLYVAAGTEVFIKGTMTKQNGVVIDVPESKVVVTEAQTKHTIIMDAKKAGDVDFIISIDNSVISVTPIDVELNPNL